MKNFISKGKTILIMGLMGIIIISFNACNPIKKMQKNLNTVKVKSPDDALEVIGDSVNVQFNAVVPPKYFAKTAIVKVTPTMQYGSQSVKFDPILVRGEKVMDIDGVKFQYTIPYEKGGSIEFNKKVAYTPEMKNNDIKIRYDFNMVTKYPKMDASVPVDLTSKIAIGTITTSLTVKNSESVSVDPGDPKPKKVTELNATVYYNINSSDITGKAAKDFDLKTLTSSISDPKIDVTGMSLNSTASPDGSTQTNTQLASERGKSSNRYILDAFKKSKFKKVYDSAFFKKSTTNEDWNGFREVITNSDLSIKNDILTIINSNMTIDDKEANIKKLGQWEVLADKYLPKLRKSQVSLVATTRVRDFETLKKLFDDNKLDSLYNNEEIYILANKLDNADQKIKVYEFYSKRNPGDWYGDANIAAIYLKKGDKEKALGILNNLNTKFPDNKNILNNLGVIYRQNNQLDKALEMYNKAANKGVDERNNKAIIDLKKGKYEDALKNFETERCDYNKALAFILKKDYDNAKKVIACIENKTADDFYLRAVVGARTNDMELMTTSLTRAVQLNGDLRETAKKDLEFRAFWAKDEFINAIK
jgi:tetratricopeptide (TPR) repeat protein